MPAFQPYRGKPDVRNDRGGRGNVGIIRSPVRASTLPDNLALQGARELGVSLPNTATAQELFNACSANGGGSWDHSALVRALEIMANHTVAGPEQTQKAA